MVRLVALLANGRRLPYPRLTAAVGDRPLAAAGDDVALDPVALSRVRAGMRACVTRGTARREFDRHPLPPDVEVWGKTGTATTNWGAWKKANRRPPPVGSERTDPQHLWFVGWATRPGTSPLAFAVVLHGRWEGMGGDVAAGCVARFLGWWYGEGRDR
jgi:cell division protein FtsI/penicillin-binding protein 2